MTDTKLPTPPAGTRWREYRDVVWTGDHFVFYGVGYKTAAALIVAFPKQFTDDDHAPLIALKATPTEPLPAPVVDRESAVWEMARDLVHDVWQTGRDRTEGDVLSYNDRATDALLLALAPHWPEIKALAGETVPKVTVLEGWYNVYNDGSVVEYPTEDSARMSSLSSDRHTAVRLAVVEDAS